MAPLPTDLRRRTYGITVPSFMRDLLPWLLAFIGPAAVAQHSHINAGARSAMEGSQLFFSNGSRFEAASNFLIRLLPTNSAAYGPIYFGGGDVTFTSLPTFLENGGPANFAALPGSHIEMVFETLDGPPGGELGVWDSFDGFFDATEITFTLATGTRGGTHRMALSENDASAGADPYGHIHGRKFSVSRPGFYTVGIRLIDTAANGANGGTLHAPSDLAYFQFQAGESVAGVSLTSEGTAFDSEHDPEFVTLWKPPNNSVPRPSGRRLLALSKVTIF